MSHQFHNQKNIQKDEGEILYEEIIEVEVEKYDPKELAFNKENFILPGNPRITTLIPPKRTLSSNSSKPFIYQNNKFDKEFYNKNIPNFLNNNLKCTCGLMENYFNNKRYYSSKNIRNSNSSFFQENRTDMNLNISGENGENLSSSNHSMPVCTCGLSKNYSFSNFRKPINIYEFDKKFRDNKYISNCPCGINYENYQRSIPNNKSFSYEPNRSQRQMIIKMSTAGEEINNLVKNINLKKINYSNKMNQNKCLKIPNIDYIPYAPSYYFTSNLNYNNKTMPKLFPSQDNSMNYICTKYQCKLKNKNLKINNNLNNSLPLILDNNFNNDQFSIGYNQQRIATNPTNNQLYSNQNRQDNFIENSNKYNIINQNPYISTNLNYENEKINNFPNVNNENINIENIMKSPNMNFNKINNNKNLNLNEYNNNETINEKIKHFSGENNDLLNINTDKKQNLNEINNQYNYNDINEKQNINNNNIYDIKENNLNMNYNINEKNNKNDNLNDNIKNSNMNSNKDQKENINYKNLDNNEYKENLNYNENKYNIDNNNINNKEMKNEANNEDKKYEEMNNGENNKEINKELEEKATNSNEYNVEINYDENNQINNINENNNEIKHKENNIINTDNENNYQNIVINAIDKENLNENNLENNESNNNIDKKENEEINNYENNMNENDNYQPNFDIIENNVDNKNKEETNNKNNIDMNYNENINYSEKEEKINLIQNNEEINNSINNKQMNNNQSDGKNQKVFNNKKNKDMNNYKTIEKKIESSEKEHLKSNINYENVNYDKDNENLKSNESNKSKENNNFNLRQNIFSNENLKNVDYNSSQSERFNLLGSESSNKVENINDNNQNENINKFETLNSINNKENINININNDEKENNFETLKNIQNEEKDEEYEDRIKHILQKNDNSKINLNQNKTQNIKIKNIPKKPINLKKNQTSYSNMAKKIEGEKTKNKTNLKKGNYSQKNLKKKNNVDININSNDNIKNKTKENNSSSKTEIQIEKKTKRKIKFSPKKIKSKPIDPLLSKYEELQGNNNNELSFNKTESNYKNQKEIFPSTLGIGIPSYYKTKISQNKNNNQEMSPSNNNEKKLKKYETKSYFSYKSINPSDNPFEGPSQYEKSQKERKNYIAKAVEKEENEFYDISYLEESIFSKKDLKEDELSQLINHFINILYKDVDKILNNKDEFKSYNYKISRITNIIVYMKNIDQIKVMEALKRTADSKNKMEIFEKLSNEIDEINKFLKNRGYKFENIPNSKEAYSFRYKNN